MMKIFFAVFLSAGLLYADAPSSPVKIGWSTREVSESAPTLIHGQLYLRISKGVRDPLTVTALVIENESDCLLMLSCDVTILPGTVVHAIRERISKRIPVDPRKLLLNATHTHTGGDLALHMSAVPGKNFPAESSLSVMPSETYSKLFCDRAAEAVIDAWNSRKPGALAWGYGYAVTGHNRRVCYLKPQKPNSIFTPIPNGTAVMYGPNNTPDFSHYETGADSTMNLLYTFDQNGILTGAVINTACPSQCSESENRQSADFWFEVRNNLRKKYGNIHILPQCAAAGDLSPHNMQKKKAEKRRLALKKTTVRQEIADRISDAFSETLAWAKTDMRRSVRLVNRYEEIQIPLRRWFLTDLIQDWMFRCKVGAARFQTGGTAQERFRFNSSLGIMKASLDYLASIQGRHVSRATATIELHTAAIDDIAFVSNPFELFMDYMHRIQARSPFTQTFVVQLAGDEKSHMYHGYLPTERAERGQGYSAVRYTSPVDFRGGQILVERSLSSLNGIFSGK